MLVIFGEQLIVAVGPGWNSNLVSGCALQQLSDVTVLDVLVVTEPISCYQGFLRAIVARRHPPYYERENNTRKSPNKQANAVGLIPNL